MATWIGLLRGINLGAHRRMAMADLRAVLEAAGLRDVRTLIQSGNVVCASPARRADAVRERMERAIADHFGFHVAVVIRTPAELEAVIAANPFALDTPPDMRVNVTFMASEPDAAAVAAIESIDGGPERVRVLGRELYMLRLPRYPHSVYTQPLFDRLDRSATTRTLAVVERIAALAR